MNKKQLILVDDHPLYRIGLRDIITEYIPQVTLVAEYGSGEELLKNLHDDLLPDLLLLDVVMPGMNGIETARIVREKYPEIKIIMLSAEVSKKYLEELLKIGVNGYLSKLANTEVLKKAIEEVIMGQQFWGREISKILYDIYISETQKKKTTKPTLTNTEEKIVLLLCEGLTIKEIAERLELSSRTIDTHKANIMRKMGFHSIVDIIKYAIKEGIFVL